MKTNAIKNIKVRNLKLRLEKKRFLTKNPFFPTTHYFIGGGKG